MPVRIWAPVLLLAVTGAGVALSTSTWPVHVETAAEKAVDRWKGLQIEADTSRLADHHLWITVHTPGGPGRPARSIRYDAYRQVLKHYGDARKIPLSFTVAPPL